MNNCVNKSIVHLSNSPFHHISFVRLFHQPSFNFLMFLFYICLAFFFSWQLIWCIMDACGKCVIPAYWISGWGLSYRISHNNASRKKSGRKRRKHNMFIGQAFNVFLVTSSLIFFDCNIVPGMMTLMMNWRSWAKILPGTHSSITVVIVGTRKQINQNKIWSKQVTNCLILTSVAPKL